jgi:hypothetical protein
METKSSAEIKEDLLIKRLLIGGAVVSVVGFLVVATAIAVMVSANFNILEWME